jgi:hypothetical protein
MKFRSEVLLGGKTATGIQVPDEVVASLGAGHRPKVRVTIGGYTYRTTVARMSGMFLIPLNAENRAASRVGAGDMVDVTIEPHDEPRDVEGADDLRTAIAREPAAEAWFNQLSYTHRKEWVRWVEEAKREETRRSRIEKTVASLAVGQRSH